MQAPCHTFFVHKLLKTGSRRGNALTDRFMAVNRQVHEIGTLCDSK